MGLRDILGLTRAVMDRDAAARQPVEQEATSGREWSRGLTLSFQSEGSLSLQGEETLLEQIAGSVLAQRISRSEALQVAAMIRARNLICGTLGRLPLRAMRADFEPRDDLPWLRTPDPTVGRPAMMAQTYEDIWLYGVGWWKITRTDANGFPAAAARVSPRFVTVDQTSAFDVVDLISDDFPFPTSGPVFVNGVWQDPRTMIRFDSPGLPILVHGAGSIRTLLELDRATRLYAKEKLPLGYFRPVDGADPLSQEEIDDALDEWQRARSKRAWGFINSALEAHALQWNPEQLQLVEARQNAVLDIARLSGIDPEDMGVSTTSRTYQNALQRRQDLIDFTYADYAEAVGERLSRDDVTPHGTTVKVDFGRFAKGDPLSRMQTYKAGKDVGAFTDDEIREAEEKPRLTPAQRRDARPVATLRPVPAPNQDTDEDDDQAAEA